MAINTEVQGGQRLLFEKALSSITVIGCDINAWFSAAYLASSWPQAKVSVVRGDSSTVRHSSISTTPLLKKSFDALGLEESQWMPASKAYYKVANLFYNWNGQVSFHHSYPSDLDNFYAKLFDKVCELRRQRSPVDANPDDYFFSSILASNKRKPIAPYSFPFEVHYGYHADTDALTQCLRDFALSLGVVEINSIVVSGKCNAQGELSSLLLEGNREHSADFYINASSEKDNVIAEAMTITHDSFSDRIINNRCLSFSQEVAEEPHQNRTTSMALDYGWLQIVPVKGRLDYNFFYSDQFIDDDRAASWLMDLLKLSTTASRGKGIECSSYGLESYQTQTAWQKNCLNVGCAQGHLDPLELDALHFTQVALRQFLNIVNSGSADKQLIGKYNKDTSNRYAAAIDYTQAHYLLASQLSSDYWRYQKEHCQVPEDVEALMEAWLSEKDLPEAVIANRYSPFGSGAWPCLLAGHRHFLKADATIACPKNYDKEIAKRDRFYQGCLKNFPIYEDS